jgi:hypothetical protein
MSDTSETKPYVEFKPGDLITAEAHNEMQLAIKGEIEANTKNDQKNYAELQEGLKNVDAKTFGGKTPDGWKDDLDKRYIKRDEPQNAGRYKRYFRQVDQKIAKGPLNDTGWEPVVIEHKLCRFPIVEVYELQPLFPRLDVSRPNPVKGAGAVETWPFDPAKAKFLVFYASNRDPFAEWLSTEAGERIYWGDTLAFILDQIGIKPAPTQKLDDVLNDMWGKIFKTDEEDTEFSSESYGHTPYVQKWIDPGDKSYDDLVKGGQWDDLRLAMRPLLLSVGDADTTTENEVTTVTFKGPQVFHISQNALEVRMDRASDLMILLRS